MTRANPWLLRVACLRKSFELAYWPSTQERERTIPRNVSFTEAARM